MKTFHIILGFVILTSSQQALGQYNFIIDSLIRNPNNIKMIPIKGVFKMEPLNKQRNTRIYNFSYKPLGIKYYEVNEDNQCDEIQVLGKKVDIAGEFENKLLACNLDITSFNIFKFTFSKRRYILIKAIKAGSGEATSFIIFNLFDISNPRDIKYYPLWSIYGSTSCFGDFNNNGKLEFLRIRNNWRQTGKNTYKIALEELKNERSKFVPCDDEKYISPKNRIQQMMN